MSVKINIVTPAGSLEGLEETILSVRRASKFLNKYSFNHKIIFNNNVKPKIISRTTGNYTLEIIDINPVASRSAARNKGINLINENKNSFVIFLDVGDELLKDAIEHIQTLSNDDNNKDVMIICNSYIKFSEKLKLISVPLFPIYLKFIVNPFMIGGVIINTSLAKKNLFYEGKKEDWVYWNKILIMNPKLKFTKKYNYIYNVTHLPKHYKNKLDSIMKLRKILVEQYKWSRINSYIIFLIHFLLISLRWTILRIKYFLS